MAYDKSAANTAAVKLPDKVEIHYVVPNMTVWDLVEVLNRMASVYFPTQTSAAEWELHVHTQPESSRATWEMLQGPAGMTAAQATGVQDPPALPERTRVIVTLSRRVTP